MCSTQIKQAHIKKIYASKQNRLQFLELELDNLNTHQQTKQACSLSLVDQLILKELIDANVVIVTTLQTKIDNLTNGETCDHGDLTYKDT